MNRFLEVAIVGDRVTFEGDRMPYEIAARNARFIICTRGFGPKNTRLYTICDLYEDVRGPDNMVFCSGYENIADCEERLKELSSGKIEVSHRRRLYGIKLKRFVPKEMIRATRRA
jgi:hypothetical protein